MKALSLIITLIMTTSSPAWGQSGKPRTLNELAAYTGPDRQKIILDGAKAEGKVLWYTSLSGNYRELVDAVKKRYPEVQIGPTSPLDRGSPLGRKILIVISTEGRNHSLRVRNESHGKRKALLRLFTDQLEQSGDIRRCYQ